jgi:5-methylcytosine-specific restriction endonuclease McrA
MAQCMNCKKTFEKIRNTFGKFCNNKCQIDFQYSEYILRWKQGKEKGYRGKTAQLSSYLRKYLLQKNNYACQECGWDRRHPIDNNPLVEVDHTDGNAKNCREDNLRLLCPNCHSMTATFRARNKNSQRKRSP